MVKTNPINVQEALRGLFHVTMNVPQAALYCGMTQREMKMAFREYLKYHEMTYNREDVQLTLL